MPCWAVVAAVRGAKPSVERSAADPVLAEQIGCLHASLVFLQDRNDLLFRVPLALHRLVLSQGQTPVHPGSIQWGNVSRIGLLPGGLHDASRPRDRGCRFWSETKLARWNLGLGSLS
jgi:hypothetical protein